MDPNAEFEIPLQKDELLSLKGSKYYVKDLVTLREIPAELKVARAALREDGPNFILEKFPVYFSIAYYAEKVKMYVVEEAIEDMTRACAQLYNNMELILEDELSPDEQAKHLKILKMTVYIFTELLQLAENVLQALNAQKLAIPKGRGKRRPQEEDNCPFTVEKKLAALLQLYYILLRPIEKLWDPPVVEDEFIKLIANICYSFLENPNLKSEKEVRDTTFQVLGTLIKQYNHTSAFPLRLINLTKSVEHSGATFPDGIKIIVKEYNCPGVVKALVQECLEVMTVQAANENQQNQQGNRFCSEFMMKLALLLPDVMIPEVEHLIKFLTEDSYVLRICILTLIAEAILQVFSSENMGDEQRSTRDKFLDALEDHVWDVHANVRSKVLQLWIRLHTECAIPLKRQGTILKKAIDRLDDKAVSVRKYAIILITTFLQCNPYAAELDFDTLQQNRLKAELELVDLKCRLRGVPISRIQERHALWTQKENDILKVIKTKIEEGFLDNHMEAETERDMSEVAESIQMLILNGKYEEAFANVLFVESQMAEKLGSDNCNGNDLALFYLTFMYKIFVDVRHANSEEPVLNDDEIKALEDAQSKFEFLRDASEFIILVNSAMEKLGNLLYSVSTSDVTGAIEFFVAARQFRLETADEKLAEMIILIRSGDRDKKEAVVNAYKTVYLSSDKRLEVEHAAEVVKKLMRLIQKLHVSKIPDMITIITQWIEHDEFPNGAVSFLWDIFIFKQPDTTVKDACTAAVLLRMICTARAALGKKDMIHKNIGVITNVGFTDKGMQDFYLAICSCNLLAVLSKNKTDSKEPIRREPIENEMWTKLSDVLETAFVKKDAYFPGLVLAAVELVYKVCNKPDVLAEKWIRTFVRLLKEHQSDDGTNDTVYLAQFLQLIGKIAIEQFAFLDVVIYKEMHRRNAIAYERKNKKQRKEIRSKKSTSSASLSMQNSTINNEDENEMEGGPTTDDRDALFIFGICEKSLVTENLLGRFTPIILNVCQNPKMYPDENVQAAASMALLSYVLVSSEFCKSHVQLYMTLMERSEHQSVKMNLIVGFADLMSRFPNSIEPWSSHLYNRLRDSNIEVRKCALQVQSQLVLKDMLRVKSYISEVVLCTDDEDKAIKEQSRTFLRALSKKDNKLYNILPDMISKLTDHNLNMEEEKFRRVMRFLMGLIEKDKQIENLVDKICIRFNLIENDRQCRDIAFCLTLLNYSEKSLQNLLGNFKLYKDKLQNDEVYALFNAIITQCNKSSKPEVKAVAAELENRIQSSFNTNADDNADESRNVFRTPAPVRKGSSSSRSRTGSRTKPPPRKSRRVQRKSSTSSSSEDDDD